MLKVDVEFVVDACKQSKNELENAHDASKQFQKRKTLIQDQVSPKVMKDFDKRYEHLSKFMELLLKSKFETVIDHMKDGVKELENTDKETGKAIENSRTK